VLKRGFGDFWSGRALSFWHDLWCGDRLLKLCYPVLYSIARHKDARVADNLFVQDGVTQWNVVQNWKVKMVLSLFERLYSIQVRDGEEDWLVWSPSKGGQFEVKSFYEVLIRQDGPSFPWKRIWCVKAPSKVAFFVWTATLGKILTHDNLRKRNVLVVEWCCMCKKSGESIDHLLLHCEVACNLWNYILTLFGVQWVMPRKVLELFTCWGDSFRCDPTKEVWLLVPLCLMWCLWHKRDARLFEDVETSMLELRKLLLNTLYMDSGTS